MNKERKVYHVVWDESDSRWEVQFEGSQRASETYETKEEAVDAARRLAQNYKPSQLIVHRKDGEIQTEYTYGDDPYPPSG